jgi:MoxR-like ATPase
VLFDEIEKAHPDVFNVLLQVLDDGRITDAQGRTVDFKNTIIIMTSNIGSRFLLEGVTGDTIPESVRESVMAELRQAFRPEFLNRIDETIMFKPLTLEEIGSIVDLLLADLNRRWPTAASSWRSTRRRRNGRPRRATTPSSAPGRSSATSSARSRPASPAPSSAARSPRDRRSPSPSRTGSG